MHRRDIKGCAHNTQQAWGKLQGVGSEWDLFPLYTSMSFDILWPTEYNVFLVLKIQTIKYIK